MKNLQPLLYWVEQREHIRLCRARGLPPPWTTDDILATYRFCNVRRRDDRVSQWVIKSVIEPNRFNSNLWVMLALTRYVNWPDTLQEIMDAKLWPVSKDPDWRSIGEVINARVKRGEKAWTGAYMIQAEPNKKKPWFTWGKGRYVSEIIVGRELWKNRRIITPIPRTAQDTWERIVGRYGWGSFMAGQVVADYTYSPLLKDAPDLYTWAPLGPGSCRGLNRLYDRPLKASMSPVQAVKEMSECRDAIITELGKDFSDLTLHDVQNCLCETDKYLRVKLGQGKPRSKFKPHQP